MQVIQIFKRARLYKKAEFRETNVKVSDWDRSLISQNGYLKDGELCLPENAGTVKNNKNLELVIIQDVKSNEGTQPIGLANTHQFAQTLPFRFEIFQFRKCWDGLEVWLLDYQKLIGTPAREPHQIGVIKPGKPIRYLVNGKFDSRRQRIILEFDYIIEFLGTASCIHYLKSPFQNVEKNVPYLQSKVVDERKLMY